MNKQLVVLLAAVLHARKDFCVGNVCPVCGGVKKDELSMTCSKCRGKANFNAVEEVISGVITALKGHREAQKGGVERNIVFEEVLSNAKIFGGAKMKTPGRGIQPYLEYGIPIDGGNLNVFVFGAEEGDAGKMITGIVELLTKTTAAGEVPYIRIQKVVGVTSDATLCVANLAEKEVIAKNIRADLPVVPIKTVLHQGGSNERMLTCLVGFRNA